MSSLAAPKKQFVRDLKDKDTVSAPFLIKYSAVAMDKNGKPYLNLVFCDQSGEIDGRMWQDVTSHVGQAVQDTFVMVEGKCQLHQGRRQVIVQKLQILREDQVDPKQYVVEGRLDVEALHAEMLAIVDSMRDPFYKALCESVLRDDADVTDRIKRAPAAKSVHHAYKGGMIEHVVSVVKLIDQIAQHYGKTVDRDLMILGGFFHDIGKLWELSYDRVTDYTTEGRLIGHLVMGVELIERKVRELEAQENRLPGPFPEEKKLLAKHMILAHHGKLEYGSPKEPHVLEALIVHYVDDLDSKVNAITGFIQNDSSPGRWTGLNRMYERYFWKPDWAVEAQHPRA